MEPARGCASVSRKRATNMTYRGRPSQGCQTCKRRKKKCDNAEPSCKNCAKSGWKCPGYPNSLDLLFRHENAKVVEKAKAAQREPRGASSDRRHLVRSLDQSSKAQDGNMAHEHPKKDMAQIPDCQENPEQTSLNILCPGATLSLDLDELAFGYFFHYYVIRDEEVSDSWRAAECDSCLSASIMALGSAGVTNSGPGSCCSPAAQARYLDAIRQINSALRSPSDVKKDSVLLSVNLLGIFERITGYHKSLEAWHNHVEGAAALLRHRGSEQFETAEGGRLFMRTATTLVLSCVGRRCPIPAHIHRLMEMAEEQIPLPKDKMWLVLRLVLRFADLYAIFPPGTILSTAEDIEALILDALMLDREMAALLGDFDEDWYFETVHINGPTVFAGVMHVYSHWTVAQMCNGMRWERILIHDMVARALRACADPNSLRLSAADMANIHNGTDTVRQLQHDIFASVPQHLSNHFPELNFFEPLSTTCPDRGSRDRMWTSFTIKDSNPWRFKKRQRPSLPLVRMSCGSQLPWALYIAGLVDPADEAVRTWIIKILRLLGQDMGLPQPIQLAQSLAMYVSERLCVGDWP